MSFVLFELGDSASANAEHRFFGGGVETTKSSEGVAELDIEFG